MANKDPVIKVRSSLLWALFHGNITRLLFPERMVLDDTGITFKSVRHFTNPFNFIDEKVFFTSIADERLEPAVLLASIEIVTNGGDLVALHHVWRGPAKRFVAEARGRKGGGGKS
ncbi:MAG: hypothetical protein WB760_01300 [Xanthobacteraceae bacterium]